MVTRVLLPSQFRAETLFELVQQEFGTFEVIPDEVHFDFSRLSLYGPPAWFFSATCTGS